MAAVLTLEGGAAWTARHVPGPVMQAYRNMLVT
jgi:hypothetical protein